jgi:hypothetical protein
VLAAVDWEALTVPGAFMLGAVLATVATIRVVRSVTNFFTHTTEHRDRPGPRGTDRSD